MRPSEAHDIEAARRWPGPAYLQVLSWVHEELRPRLYVEIGVDWGESLRLAAAPTVAIGIDPAPRSEACRFQTVTYVFPMTSGAFFRSHSSFASGFAFAFIDGSHLFEQVLEDFLALESCAAPDAVIALHDTIPLDEETSSRERTTLFYTGDAYRILLWLDGHRPELDVVTVETAPTGLTLVRRAPKGSQRRIPNDPAVVVSWLRGSFAGK